MSRTSTGRRAGHLHILAATFVVVFATSGFTPGSCGECLDGEVGGASYHVFQCPPPPFLSWADPHCDEDWGTCFQRHTSCSLALVRALDALEQQGFGEIAVINVLLQHPESVQYNLSREMVQFLGCSGDVVGQVPVTPGSLVAIVAARADRLANARSLFNLSAELI